MIPVVLSGGSGTRLWPVSRQQMPKQFCDIFAKPLQTLTLQRALRLGSPWIITSEVLRSLTEDNWQSLKAPGSLHALYEPMAKNTAPAIGLLCRALELKGLQDEVAAVFPSDHLIQQEERFLEIVKRAEILAKQKKIVTLGIHASYPETGYGYIQTEKSSQKATQEIQAFPVLKFHEKPAYEKAKEFVASGNFHWNAGIFVFQVSRMIELFKKHQPEIWQGLSQLKSDLSNLKDIYQNLNSISIDYAIMEKLSESELVCIPGDFGWSDVGSWDAVASLMEGQTHFDVKANNNFVFGINDKKYSFVGVENVILVDTPDATVVMQKGQSQEIRQVVEHFTKSAPEIVQKHRS